MDAKLFKNTRVLQSRKTAQKDEVNNPIRYPLVYVIGTNTSFLPSVFHPCGSVAK